MIVFRVYVRSLRTKYWNADQLKGVINLARRKISRASLIVSPIVEARVGELCDKIRQMLDNYKNLPIDKMSR